MSDSGIVTFSSLWARLFLRKETKVLILGLDNAGKVSLCNQSCTVADYIVYDTVSYNDGKVSQPKIATSAARLIRSVVASAPTVGSNYERYEWKGVNFGLIDIGGQTSLRSSWSQYFVGTSAIILVIDSSDAGRLPLAKAELEKLTQAEVGPRHSSLRVWLT
jgi:GTPase SAR1 family protein